jgi:hypothetical protein
MLSGQVYNMSIISAKGGEMMKIIKKGVTPFTTVNAGDDYLYLTDRDPCPGRACCNR